MTPSGYRKLDSFPPYDTISGTFLPSNTPFEPSKFPGAGSVRICTAAHFQVTGTDKKFTLLNTHLDDQSDAQRRLAGSMLLTRARFEAVTTNAPVFVQGDFNRWVFFVLSSSDVDDIYMA